MGFIKLTNEVIFDKQLKVLFDTHTVTLDQLQFSTATRLSTSRLSPETTALTVKPFNIRLKMMRNLDKDLKKPCSDTQVLLTLEDIYFELDQEQYSAVDSRML